MPIAHAHGAGAHAHAALMRREGVACARLSTVACMRLLRVNRAERGERECAPECGDD